MLIQFSVSNYLSIKDEVLLSMVPAKSRTMKEHIISNNANKPIDVLPLATIYGANASGKSNFIRAISFMRSLVIKGTSPDRLTGVVPYRLDIKTEQEPSRFEIIFKHDGILYTYGFVISGKTVHEEWLFAYYTAQESKLFERITKEDKTEVFPGGRLITDAKGIRYIDFLAKSTRANQLFLTEAYGKNIKIFEPVIHWFREHLTIIRTVKSNSLRTISNDKYFLDYISNFLQIADTGIKSIKYQTEEFDSNRHLSKFPEEFRKKINEDLAKKDPQLIVIGNQNSRMVISNIPENNKSPTLSRLMTEHTRSDGKMILFELESESDGTRQLIDLVPMLIDVWKKDRVFVIDELERSLHPQISRLFIKACLESVKEKKALGQFIATTHDTNLLDRNLLRRDEIYFMEKDLAGGSHLTSLAEYKINEGLNYENGYLNGRFGAIPFIGNIKEFLK